MGCDKYAPIAADFPGWLVVLPQYMLPESDLTSSRVQRAPEGRLVRGRAGGWAAPPTRSRTGPDRKENEKAGVNTGSTEINPWKSHLLADSEMVQVSFSESREACRVCSGGRGSDGPGRGCTWEERARLRCCDC